MADSETDLGEEKKSSNKLVIILAAVVVLLLVIAGTLYFTGYFSSADNQASDAEEVEDPTEEAELEKITIYHPLEPPFIINFQKGHSAKLLQVGITVLANSESAIEALKQHSPMIRNNLLMFFNEQEPDKLRTRAGKEVVQASVLKEIQKIVDKQTGDKGIEAVFFTEFVMQ